jgi:hypothetical protein
MFADGVALRRQWHRARAIRARARRSLPARGRGGLDDAARRRLGRIDALAPLAARKSRVISNAAYGRAASHAARTDRDVGKTTPSRSTRERDATAASARAGLFIHSLRQVMGSFACGEFVSEAPIVVRGCIRISAALGKSAEV